MGKVEFRTVMLGRMVNAFKKKVSHVGEYLTKRIVLLIWDGFGENVCEKLLKLPAKKCSRWKDAAKKK